MVGLDPALQSQPAAAAPSPAAAPPAVMTPGAAWVWRIAMAVLLLAAASALVQLQQQSAARARGQALYAGLAPLPGRLAGHQLDLPSLATRCVNCHEGLSAGTGVSASTNRETPASAAQGARFGAALNADALATPRPRRGGPASVYDAQALCSLLRSGLDPAQVMVDTAMPRYPATDGQCEDLWAFLSQR